MSTLRPYGQMDQEELFNKIRHAAGIVLIAVGLLMALFVFLKIYQLIDQPKQLKVFMTLIPEYSNVRNLEIGGEKVVLPMGLFYFLSYIVMVILLSVASGIGIGFIKAGVGLLYPRVDRLEAKLYKESMKLNNKIDSKIAKLSMRFPQVYVKKPTVSSNPSSPSYSREDESSEDYSF